MPPALEQCPACNHDVSTSAATCPHCGHPLQAPRQPPDRARQGCLVVALVIVAILGVMFLVTLRDSRSPGPTYRLSEPTFGGGGNANSNANDAHGSNLGDAQRKLSKMSPAQLNTTMTQYMKASGHGDCVVVETFYQGSEPKTGDAFWNVRCSNKEAFAVSVANDAEGSTSVLGCGTLKAVAKVECFKRFE